MARKAKLQGLHRDSQLRDFAEVLDDKDFMATTLGGTDGALIGSTVGTDGTNQLHTSTTQNVYADPNNSSTDNLDAANSYTFTGTATTTLGVVGLQWGLKTDQNATVYIEESNDGTNWDISYEFDYIANQGGRGETVQASLAYWRIRVVLTGTTDTTYFRLSGVLCPVAVPLPSELSPDGRCKVQSTLSGRENTERHVWVNPTNELAISPVYRMVGTAFDNTTKDTNFWTETTVNGSVAQAGGVLTLQTSAAINSSAKYVSVRRARFVPGSAQLFNAGMAMTAAPVAGNTRRVGAYDTNNGFYMQVADTTFSIGYRKAAADTLVSTGSFNGNYGSSWSPELDTYYKVQIEFTPLKTTWYINGVKLHSIRSAGLSDTLTLPITLENINTTNDTDIDLKCVSAYIAREGELQTNATYYHISGNAATHILKYGAGVLHKIVFNNTSGTSITIYDNTSAAAPIMGIITTASGIIGSQEYNVPFSNGLTLVTVGNSLDATIVYE